MFSIVRSIALWLTLALAALTAQAQAYPTKPIRVVNPWGAGGAADAIVRPVMLKLSEVFGQSIVVDNQAGASGMIGTTTVAKAAPDGYTLLMGSLGPNAISPVIEARVAYDPVKDFEPVTQLVSSPLVLVVRSGLPVQNVPELIAYAKANPMKLTYGSVGAGSTTHLGFEMLSQMSGTEFLHVPYKGSAQVANDLAGGQVDMAFINIAGALPLLQSPRVRLLAVSTAQRAAAAPQIPSVAETLPGYDLNSWWGILAPGGTPKPIVARLQLEIAKILASKDVAQHLRDAGVEPEGSTPEQFAAVIRKDLARWGEIVKARHLKTN